MMKAQLLEKFQRDWKTMSEEERYRVSFDNYAKLLDQETVLNNQAALFIAINQQYKAVIEENEKLEKENISLLQQNKSLTDQLTLLQNAHYGVSSEAGFNADSEAGSFDNPIDDEGPEIEPEETEETPNGSQKKNWHINKDGTLRRSKSEMDLSKLPVRRLFKYDPESYDSLYGKGNWKVLFWEEEKKIICVPKYYYVSKTYVPVIVDLTTNTMVRPHLNESIIKGKSSSSLLADVLTSKYLLRIPLYLQETLLEGKGLPLSRQTMSNWVCKLGNESFQPVYQYLKRKLSEEEFQQCDESYFQVILDGRKKGSKSFVWVHLNSELSQGPKMVVYCYEPTRNSDHLEKFCMEVKGKHIYISCDAYAGYKAFAKRHPEFVTLSNCLTHDRRNYVNAAKLINSKEVSKEEKAELCEYIVLGMIAKIFKEEEKLKDLSPEKRKELRQKNIKPLLDAYHTYIHEINLDDPKVSASLKKAIQYTINNEEDLNHFLLDGNIPLDNSASERAIRPFAVGRKVWLFSYTPNGAKASMVMYSLVETAKANKANPYYYFLYLCDELPKHEAEKDELWLETMMPWSKEYKEYEEKQLENISNNLVPPSMEMPVNPRKPKSKPEVPIPQSPSPASTALA